MGDGLGDDAAVCISAFVEAMRRTLPEESKPKLDRAEVRAGLVPLGEAVFDIAVGPAQTRSDGDEDAAFWAWVVATQRWMEGTERWRRALTRAAERIESPGRGPLAQLLEALREAPPPPAPPERAPASLRGRIR